MTGRPATVCNLRKKRTHRLIFHVIQEPLSGKNYQKYTPMTVLMPLMHAMHDTIDMDNPYEMMDIILDRYNSEDPITQYNRENIIFF